MSAGASVVQPEYTHVAYVVTDSDGEESVVVHARNPMEARRLGSYELSDCADETTCEVRRAPEFDGITDEDDLVPAQLDQGWWFPCLNCGRRVNSEGLFWDDDRDDDEEAGVISRTVFRNGTVYCSSRCCIAWLRGERDARVGGRS